MFGGKKSQVVAIQPPLPLLSEINFLKVEIQFLAEPEVSG